MRALLVLIPFALLTSAQLSFNGSTLTSASALSSARAALIPANIPSSLIPALAIEIQSAAASAGISGNINQLVSSVLTAPTPAPFLTAIAPSYQSRFSALESQISRIGKEASDATVRPTLTRNATVVVVVSTMGSVVTSSFAAEIVNGTNTRVVSALNETGSGTTSMASQTGEGSTGGAAAEPTGGSEEGMAVGMRVPLAAAVMGVLGLVAVAVVL